jgi:hypothetical protein
MAQDSNHLLTRLYKLIKLYTTLGEAMELTTMAVPGYHRNATLYY